MRQDVMIEGALVISHTTQNKGKFMKTYPLCEHGGKNRHPSYKCWEKHMHSVRTPYNFVIKL